MSSPSISTQHASYIATSLSEERVAKNSGFLMWDTQPALFKAYPKHLFSYRWDAHEAFKAIKSARTITSTISVANSPYYRLNTPSAGNLHPLELYVQIRGIKGVLSGIYHVDVKNETLVLIQEIEADGLEAYVGKSQRFQGMIFVLSTVYFRSFWKYGIRAWRYLYLDAGHQIAAIQASLSINGLKAECLSGFDTKGLNHIMGFEKQEHVVAVMAIGEDKQKRYSKPFEKALMQVQPTDYCIKDVTIQTWLEEAKVFSHTGKNIYDDYDKSALEKAVYQRRSAREFDATPLFKKDLKQLVHRLSALPKDLELSYAVVNAKDQKVGLYHSRKIGEGPKDDFLHERIVSLLVNQSIVASAGVVIFISSNKFNEQVLMQAGHYAHQIYIDSALMGLGCSGIGAFFDEELCTLLEKKYMLYALVVGNI